MTVPVSFTSTGPNEMRLDGLTWTYAEHSENGTQHRQLRVKVKEISEFVLDKIIPETATMVGKLAGASDDKAMSTRDAQIILARRGYYPGKTDGVVNRETVVALPRYQQDHFLEASGYLDLATQQRLRAE